MVEVKERELFDFERENAKKGKIGRVISIVLCVVFFISSLSFFALWISDNKALDAKESEWSEKNASAEQVISDYEEKLEKQKENNSKLQKENSSLKEEVSSLYGETKALKSEIEQMSKKKNNKTDGKSESTGEKVCYLTFDDGPSENTLKILNILKKKDAKATFFVTGNKKLKYISRIHKEGHALGLHTNSHIYSECYASADAFYDDIGKLSKKIKKIVGFEPEILRFPGGSSNMISANYKKGIMSFLTKDVEKKGYVYFDWNVSNEDATGDNISAKTLVNNVKKGVGVKTKICILMHDTDAKDTTVKALPEIIDYLKKEGFVFSALDKNSPVFHHGINN